MDSGTHAVTTVWDAFCPHLRFVHPSEGLTSSQGSAQAEISTYVITLNKFFGILILLSQKQEEDKCCQNAHCPHCHINARWCRRKDMKFASLGKHTFLAAIALAENGVPSPETLNVQAQLPYF